MRITARLAGKQIHSVWENGHTCELRLVGGESIQLQWLDDDGAPLKGKLSIKAEGFHIRAKPLVIPKSAIG